MKSALDRARRTILTNERRRSAFRNAGSVHEIVKCPDRLAYAGHHLNSLGHANPHFSPFVRQSMNLRLDGRFRT